MNNDAEVNRNAVPDSEYQEVSMKVENFLRTIPYLMVKVSQDEIKKRFGEDWENVLEILKKQGVSVTPCVVYEYQKWRFIGTLEEKCGYKFQPKLNDEGQIINTVLRERYEAARIKADELFVPNGRIQCANWPECDMPEILGEDWQIVLGILQEERKFKIEPYKVWKRYGFLELRKVFAEWRYLITAPDAENSE